MHPKMAALRVGVAVVAFVSFVGWATAGTFAPLTEPELERLFVEAPQPVAAEDGDGALAIGDESAANLRRSSAARNRPAHADLPAARARRPVGTGTVSDKVGATAGEFRVDASGAATYSIPLYTRPGHRRHRAQADAELLQSGRQRPAGQGSRRRG